MKRLWWVLLVSGFVFGCTQRNITLTEQGKKIELMLYPERFPLCAPRSSLHSMVLISSRNSYRQAMNQFLNDAASSGSTHITIDTSRSDALATEIRGRGYYCPTDYAQKSAETIQNQDALFIMDE